MKQRTMFGRGARIGRRLKLTAAVLLSLAGGNAAFADALRLENANVAVEIEAAHGRILRIADRERGIDLAPPAALASNYRLVLLLPSGERRVIEGRNQALTSTESSSNQLTLRWDGPLMDGRATAQQLAVTLRIRLDDRALRFNFSLSNRTPYRVEEVWYPIFGGLRGFGPPESRGDTTINIPPWDKRFTLPFGDFTPFYPGQLRMGFVDVSNPRIDRGLYFGAHDTIARLKAFHFEEAHLGTDSDINACLVHFPHTPPAQRFDGAEAVLRFHDGGWREGGRIYRKWFVPTFGLADPKRDWIRRQSFFLMTMFMLPEGNINYTFKDIPRWARAAHACGVNAVQISGWQYGGHDNGYPYYTPDPRLGTWKDLERGIRACHQMGMKVYFFANIQPAMLDLAWYRRELGTYASMSRSGDPFWVAGWGMGTLASRMGLTTPMEAFLDPAIPAFRNALVRQFKHLAAIGADGLHIDKMFPAALDMNPRAPLGPDRSSWEGALVTLGAILQAGRSVHPGFDVSVECNWDRVLSYGAATWWVGNMTPAKEIFPELVETVGLYQPYDAIGINNSVRAGYAIMLAPHQFNRGLEYVTWRRLAGYVREVKRIRDHLADTVFMGECPGPSAALFAGAQDSAIQSNVFRSRGSGRRTCVLTNSGPTSRSVVLKGFVGGETGMVRIYRPYQPTVVAQLPVVIPVAAERIAFVEEIGRLKPPQQRRDGGARRPPVGTRPGNRLGGHLRQADGIPATHRGGSRKSTRAGNDGIQVGIHEDFESGTLDGWKADPNWAIDDNSAGGWYSGWQGRYFAWSGKGGEQRTGKLRSPVFVLDKAGVEVWTAGWADLWGHTADRWNYVALRLENGRELDRVYAPNSVTFVPLTLDGRGHIGAKVYIEAVDNADQPSFSMLCIDNVNTVTLPDERVTAVSRRGAIVLENRFCRVEVEPKHGSIVRIRDRIGGIELIGEPRLSGSFTLTLPLRGREARFATEANYIFGPAQRLTSYRRTVDTLELNWGDPLVSERGARYPVSARMRIVLVGRDVRFALTLHNRSALEIGEVSYPVLGGMTGLGARLYDRKRTELLVPSSAGITSASIFRAFQNMSPFGALGPEQYYAYPTAAPMPWMEIYNPRLNRGVYIGAHDSIARFKVMRLDMAPGVASSRPGDNWPSPEELDGQPAGVRAAFVHVVYSPPGRSFEATPVVLRFHKGGWQEAARIYGDWFRGRFSTQTAYASAAFTPCVECRPGRYGELPDLARDAARRGARAILVRTGEGVVGGAPAFGMEERLGTAEELGDALRVCHQIGLKVLFAVTNSPVSIHSEAFRRQYRKWQCLDRWGVPQSVFGWQSGTTLSEVLGSGERRVYLNPGDRSLAALLARDAASLARLGADGLRLEGFFVNALDFNRATGTTPDRANWESVLGGINGMERSSRAVNRDFAISVAEARDHLHGLMTGDSEALRTAFPNWRAIEILPTVRR